MRIAMFGHKRIPSREGGVEVVVEELATRMADMGHNVTCFNRKGSHIAGSKYKTYKGSYYKNVKLVTVPTIDIKGLAAVTSSFFAAILVAFGKYDVVHIHAEGPSVMVWLPKLFGKKCVVTMHGLDHQRKKWKGFASKYIKLGAKLSAKYADEIIVLNESHREYFLRKFGRSTVLIPNGITKPISKEPNIINNRFSLNKDSYILFLGRLVPEKGTDYLIKAFKQLDTKKKLVIAGSPSDTKEYADFLIELASKDSRIIFTGFVEGEVLSELYSNCYFYVMPSDLEAMPVGLLEAMSYGNCCLISDIQECVNVTGDKALTFEKSNVDDLRDKMNFLLNNSDKVNDFKTGVSDFVCSKFSWNDIINKTLELYSERNSL